MRRRADIHPALLLLLGLMLLSMEATAKRMVDSSSANVEDAAEGQVRCWKVQTELDGSSPTVLSTFTGEACAVSIEFPLVSARFLPNDTIPVFWTVRLLATTQTTNSLQMKNPPVATTTLSDDHAGELMQITQTNSRICASRDRCDPTMAALYSSKVQSGSFSTTGGSVLFQSVNELRIPTEGSYAIAAQVRIVDDEDPTISYYYAVFSDVTVATDKKKNVCVELK